ncbi:MAG: glycosyltransferase family 2 protein [Methylococcaceae bacterium]|nr:glycosyltransferase family 2 protein [Methylococcaceae bacterium]
MTTCIIIPVYNHERAVPKLIAALKPLDLPCLLINDGSSELCTQVLEDCAKQHSDWLTLIHRPENGGKGAAMLDGFNAAIVLGFTHAIQIDADGQHDVQDIPRFIEASRLQPNALILGQPIFDDSAPKSRRYAREFTNLWIWINTLSFDVADGMCGFRLYPLNAVQTLMRSSPIAKRMDFDIDILVRLYWQGVSVINQTTHVKYPEDGVSHFDLWRDNIRISKTHATLFFGMLGQIPQLLRRHWQ